MTQHKRAEFPNAVVEQSDSGRWRVRYRDTSGTYVGIYTADGEADALDFAGSSERQRADRAFAVTKFRARTGRT